MEFHKVTVLRREDVQPSEVADHPDYQYRKVPIVSKYGRGRCCLSVYELPPGKSNYPYHYHEQVEEIFYILSGRGMLETPAGTREVTAGDFVVCPPGEGGAHRLTNCSETELLSYLDFDTVSFPDIAHYPHTGKIGVLRGMGNNLFFPLAAETAYYSGERADGK